MATGRTVSASFLTKLDEKVINLCNDISIEIVKSIDKDVLKKDFLRVFGKISKTRDGGLGLGGGKLQRDALCTRGRQGKAPYSNRNLRWRPLLVAENPIKNIKEIEKISIEGDQTLLFHCKINNKIIRFPSEKVYELPERYIILPKHWLPHIEILKNWNDTQWTQNSCVIPALEACDWFDSLETYALLSISVAISFYQIDFNKIYKIVYNLLKNQQINKNIKLPSKFFPTNIYDFIKCPICKKNISENLNEFRKEDRCSTWQPSWRSSKKDEGDDSSNQIMHVVPLIEKEFRHNAKNVRYGHRWCNVSMTDHSLDETLDFMTYIIKAHGRCKC